MTVKPQTLLELDPKWVSYDGDFTLSSTDAVGIWTKKCPCGCDGVGLLIYFSNPVGDKPPRFSEATKGWNRTGDTFESLTLNPSIKRIPPYPACGWHGYIVEGKLVHLDS